MKAKFKIKRADNEWIKEQLEKGNLFLSTMKDRMVPCGAYRENYTSYDPMSLHHIQREIQYGNIYFMLINK